MTAALTPAPTLTAGEVATLEAATRADLTGAIANLARLREGHAHHVAGFDSWAGYVIARFGDLLAQLRLPRDERRALVDSMDDAGMTVRPIAKLLGVASGTVHNDLTALGKVIPIGPRHKPAPELSAPRGKVYEQAAEWLRRADAGLTLVELAAAASWTEGKASGALSYLVGPGRGLAVRLEDRRDGQRVHVLTDLGLALAAGQP